jgi:hypothetical protein
MMRNVTSVVYTDISLGGLGPRKFTVTCFLVDSKTTHFRLLQGLAMQSQ